MDEMMYESLMSYFKVLSAKGYCKYSTVDKILVVMYIQEMFVNEFKYYMTEKDVKLMQDLLYQFIGSTCEISFPSNNKCCCISGSTPEPEPEPEPDDPTPSTTLYAYVGWASSVEDIDIHDGARVTISNNSFYTAEGGGYFTWFAIPANKTLVSVKNGAGGNEDIADGYDEHFHQGGNVTIDNTEYKMYYYEFIGRPSNNTYYVTIK